MYCQLILAHRFQIAFPHNRRLISGSGTVKNDFSMSQVEFQKCFVLPGASKAEADDIRACLGQIKGRENLAVNVVSGGNRYFLFRLNHHIVLGSRVFSQGFQFRHRIKFQLAVVADRNRPRGRNTSVKPDLRTVVNIAVGILPVFRVS